MRDPISSASEGVRVPDEYSFPTTTAHSRGKVNCFSNAGGTIGLALMANPILSVVDTVRANGGVATIGSPSLATYTANAYVYGATQPSSVSSKLEAFRTVAAGYKIRVQQPELRRTGTIIFAPIPMVNTVPGYNMLNTTAMTSTSQALSAIIGSIPIGVAASASILSLPGAFEMSFNDLGRVDVVLPFRPLNPRSRLFCNSQTVQSYNATSTFGDDSLVAGAGVTSVQDNVEVVSSAGWNGWLIYADGFDISVPGELVFTAEYCYHLEGSPNLSSALNATLVNDSSPDPVVDTGFMDNVLNKLAKMPWADIVDAGMSHYGIGGASSHAPWRIQF